MERLTKRVGDGAVIYIGTFATLEGGEMPDEVDAGGVRELLQRLAAYEDTGLDPEICAECKKFEDEIVASGKTFNHLIELLRAEKEGRLVVLPVQPVLTQSIGSMLYIIEDGEIIEDSLCEALIGMASNGEINIFYTTLSDQISFEQADVGKTVFLTYKDAEKALESGRVENG